MWKAFLLILSFGVLGLSDAWAHPTDEIPLRLIRESNSGPFHVQVDLNSEAADAYCFIQRSQSRPCLDFTKVVTSAISFPGCTRPVWGFDYDMGVTAEGQIQCGKGEPSVQIEPSLFDTLSSSTCFFLIYRNGDLGQSFQICRSNPVLKLPVPLLRRFLRFVDYGREHVGLGISPWYKDGQFRIPDGLDHLLLMLSLALLSFSLWQLFAISLGFTLGHMISMALLIFQIVTNNPVWIEAAIAFSIFLSAVLGGISYFKKLGSWRVQQLMALVFGLIHGLGFASTSLVRNVHPKELAFAILGMNFGVELTQMILILGVALLTRPLHRSGKMGVIPLFIVQLAIAVFAAKLFFERI